MSVNMRCITTVLIQLVQRQQSAHRGRGLLPSACCVNAACAVVGAVHVVDVQGALSHAVYRLRPIPSPVRVRRVADHCQYVDRRHLLRTVRQWFHSTDIL